MYFSLFGWEVVCDSYAVYLFAEPVTCLSVEIPMAYFAYPSFGKAVALADYVVRFDQEADLPPLWIAMAVCCNPEEDYDLFFGQWGAEGIAPTYGTLRLSPSGVGAFVYCLTWLPSFWCPGRGLVLDAALLAFEISKPHAALVAPVEEVAALSANRSWHLSFS
jgi:hypothetical protein